MTTVLTEVPSRGRPTGEQGGKAGSADAANPVSVNSCRPGTNGSPLPSAPIGELPPQPERLVTAARPPRTTIAHHPPLRPVVEHPATSARHGEQSGSRRHV